LEQTNQACLQQKLLGTLNLGEIGIRNSLSDVVCRPAVGQSTFVAESLRREPWILGNHSVGGCVVMVLDMSSSIWTLTPTLTPTPTVTSTFTPNKPPTVAPVLMASTILGLSSVHICIVTKKTATHYIRGDQYGGTRCCNEQPRLSHATWGECSQYVLSGSVDSQWDLPDNKLVLFESTCMFRLGRTDYV
jgi:hypothetical protein